MHVGEIDPAGFDRDHHLTWTGNGSSANPIVSSDFAQDGRHEFFLT
jgi:hypothetical protein